ncbi:helix-turn-helix domain-containing protein [Umezawaea sp. Da 62-37]|uniref:helix-turn-helix domain-containing protein n=1 Tax=Umezawaea sp. Da 62-37 TaxID=3075927 RepID=UPI0037DC2798
MTRPDTSTHRLLYTPAEAATLLAVRESWLRRKAGRREIPRTFVGKHLRFSDADLRSIAESGACAPRTRDGRMRTTPRRTKSSSD